MSSSSSSSLSSLPSKALSSPAGSPVGLTHSAASTEVYGYEPFETYKFKVQILCQSVGLGKVVVEWMHGGSFNRVSKITLASSGGEYILRVPRLILEKTAQDVKDQVAITSYLASYLPVPAILAYDITFDNAIEAPYVIQKLAPGQCLDDVYDNDLPIEERLQIASLIAGLIVRIELISFPTPGRLATAPNNPDRCDDFSNLTASLIIAPFRTQNWELPESASSPPVADFLDALLNKRIEENNAVLLPRWTKLCAIKQEMQAKGLLNCQNSVLWHWDLASRNVIVDRKPDNTWEVSAVLDWDGALSVPRVLSRQPPIWLWHFNLAEDVDWDGDSDLPIARQLTLEEQIIKRHYNDCIEAHINTETYCADAYNQGRWVRRLFRFANLGIIEGDWTKFDMFVKDWNSYCHGDKTVVDKAPDHNFGVLETNSKSK